jgi:hypothetical protein
MDRRLDRSVRPAVAGVVGAALLMLVSGLAPSRAGEGTGPPRAEAPLPAAEEAPTCRVDAPRAEPETTAATAAALAALRARLAQEAGGAQGAVVLNGRGYNYEQPLPADPALLRFEAKQPER